MLHSFGRKTKICYMALDEQHSVMLHTWLWKKNKSVMLHSFGRKTKVSCYMSLAKTKSVVLHDSRRKRKLSCYMGLGEKQKCNVT